MKIVNESIYRIPKWLRNLVDYEVATGKDIKGEPSLKMKAKREEKIRREKDEEDRIFTELFSIVKNYIQKNYKDCNISIPDNQIIIIEKDKLEFKGTSFKFRVIFDNNNTHPDFKVYIKNGEKAYGHSVRGTNHMNFKIFVLNVIYPWYISSKNQQYEPKYKSRGSSSWDPNGGSSSGRSSSEGSRASQNPPKNESDPVKNRERRLNLLRVTLAGYEREFNSMPKNHPDRQQKQNEIDVIKGRIKVMEQLKNESYKHLMSFQIFEKRFDPIKDDYVTINNTLTGEPTPVRIVKVYPNNTYLVSFNVDGSTSKGAPDATIKNSDIISPYRPIRSPVGSGFISANTNFQVRNTSNVNQVSNDMYL